MTNISLEENGTAGELIDLKKNTFLPTQDLLAALEGTDGEEILDCLDTELCLYLVRNKCGKRVIMDLKNKEVIISPDYGEGMVYSFYSYDYNFSFVKEFLSKLGDGFEIIDQDEEIAGILFKLKHGIKIDYKSSDLTVEQKRNIESKNWARVQKIEHYLRKFSQNGKIERPGSSSIDDDPIYTQDLFKIKWQRRPIIHTTIEGIKTYTIDEKLIKNLGILNYKSLNKSNRFLQVEYEGGKKGIFDYFNKELILNEGETKNFEFDLNTLPELSQDGIITTIYSLVKGMSYDSLNMLYYYNKQGEMDLNKVYYYPYPSKRGRSGTINISFQQLDYEKFILFMSSILNIEGVLACGIVTRMSPC